MLTDLDQGGLDSVPGSYYGPSSQEIQDDWVGLSWVPISIVVALCYPVLSAGHSS